MRLLIVDDEPLILNGLTKVIQQVAPEGTEIRQALNAVEGLEIMSVFFPDVTITDVNMPEINGFEMIEKAKAQQLCERFIILTGYDEFEYVRTALRCGAVDYILKPIDKDEIAALLGSVKSELPPVHDAEYNRQASRILSYIQVHFRKELSLDHISELTDLHPNYICSMFKKETGQNFIQYLNSLRIQEAKKLLSKESELSVSEIGKIVGFENKHYFAKVFKRYTSMTPGQYRKSVQKIME